MFLIFLKTTFSCTSLQLAGADSAPEFSNGEVATSKRARKASLWKLSFLNLRWQNEYRVQNEIVCSVLWTVLAALISLHRQRHAQSARPQRLSHHPQVVKVLHEAAAIQLSCACSVAPGQPKHKSAGKGSHRQDLVRQIGFGLPAGVRSPSRWLVPPRETPHAPGSKRASSKSGACMNVYIADHRCKAERGHIVNKALVRWLCLVSPETDVHACLI